MQNMPKDRLILPFLGIIISLVNRTRTALPSQCRRACAVRIMKGRTMNIKFAEHSRVATYGAALGLVLHAAWRGLVWFVVPGDVPGDFDPRRLRGWHRSDG